MHTRKGLKVASVVRAQASRKVRERSFSVAFISLAALFSACGGSSDGSDNNGSGATGPDINLTGGSTGTGTGGGIGSGSTGNIPSDFTKTETGGYKLGGEFAGEAPAGTNGGNTDCGNVILAVVRDFRGANDDGGHPDFEVFSGDQITTGLVESGLGGDKKPVYASKCEAPDNDRDQPSPGCPEGPQTTSSANFQQWYRNTEGVNRAFLIRFYFAPTNNGVFTFHSEYFFPLDDAGYGNSGTGNDKKRHNFHFTTEVHTQFQYNGGETFRFIGDDDVWVYINKKLALDIGGLHPTQPGEVNLDQRASELGIQRGKVYDLDLFHAERHTDASRFRIDTNLAFVNCGTLPPEVAPK